MRIVSGIYGGRTVETPKTGDLRPTQERVRASLFDILRPELPGAEFLDLFAGSGAVGLEALSQGAKRAVLVESDPRHASIAAKNAAALRAGNCEIARADAFRFVSTYTGRGFDIVFADPPYALGPQASSRDFISSLSSRGVVRSGGLYIAETASGVSAGLPSGWEMLRERTYGRTAISIMRRIQ